MGILYGLIFLILILLVYVVIGVFVFHPSVNIAYEVVMVCVLMKALTVTSQCVGYFCFLVTWSYVRCFVMVTVVSVLCDNKMIVLCLNGRLVFMFSLLHQCIVSSAFMLYISYLVE